MLTERIFSHPHCEVSPLAWALARSVAKENHRPSWWKGEKAPQVQRTKLKPEEGQELAQKPCRVKGDLERRSLTSCSGLVFFCELTLFASRVAA